jgi:putative nucleotidyltransferase with HDIG domain
MREGASDFILKPVDFDILLLSVDKVLEKRRLILENKSYQLYLEQRVAEQAKIIRESFINSVKSLVHALEAKDVYTSGHSQRVTDIATNIAEAMHWDEAQLEKIRLAGILHDIGKIGVPESILNKPGKLEKDEFEIVKTHCEIGERILRSVITDEEILKAIRHHHERYDGTGYPDGLPGDRIPQGARILAAADAYDAMTPDRPYRRAMTHSQACIELEKKSGLQFDPEVASIFLAKVALRLKLQSP